MKRTLFLAALALLAFGCSEGGGGGDKDSNGSCGDGVVDASAGEKCDPGAELKATCKDFDSTKTWKDGGAPACSSTCQLLVGTCAEDLPAGGTCGDGVRNEGEACDKGDKTVIACSTFDSSKTWKEGGAAACADDCKSILVGTCVEDLPAGGTCGDGVKNEGEVCDKGDKTPIECSVLDPNGKWKEGGAAKCKDDCSGYDVGTCESEFVPACGDGYLNGDEKCDTKGGSATALCAEIDSSKTWVEGSKANCKDDCSGYDTSTCVENLCGNGVKDGGEACDPKDDGSATIECSAYDSSKKWQTGGSARCKADCSAYEKGTCKEDTTTPEGGCSSDADCVGKEGNTLTKCDTETKQCVECLENTHCDGNATAKICHSTLNRCVECTAETAATSCTEEGKKLCASDNRCVECLTNVDCDKAVCDASNKCVKDSPDEHCKRQLAEGVYWCQLMDVKVDLSVEETKKEVKAYFHKGKDVTGDVMAKLVYDEADDKSFKTMNSWESIDAAVSSAADYDIIKATLTKEHVSANGTYYTFKLSTDGTNWVYCKRNHTVGEDSSTLDCDNKPLTIGPDNGSSTQSNHNEVGIAKVVEPKDDTVAYFDFDDIKTGFSKLSDTDCLVDEQHGVQLCGTGKTSNPSTKCANSNNSANACIVNAADLGQAMSVSGWKGASDRPADDASNVARIVLKNVKLGEAKNVLKLDMLRNNATSSPTRVAFSYSTDGESFTLLNEVSLPSSEEWKRDVWHTYDVNLDAAESQTVTLWITPYGGSGVLKFDNIVVTQRNK